MKAGNVSPVNTDINRLKKSFLDDGANMRTEITEQNFTTAQTSNNTPLSKTFSIAELEKSQNPALNKGEDSLWQADKSGFVMRKLADGETISLYRQFINANDTRLNDQSLADLIPDNKKKEFSAENLNALSGGNGDSGPVKALIKETLGIDDVQINLLEKFFNQRLTAFIRDLFEQDILSKINSHCGVESLLLAVEPTVTCSFSVENGQVSLKLFSSIDSVNSSSSRQGKISIEFPKINTEVTLKLTQDGFELKEISNVSPTGDAAFLGLGNKIILGTTSINDINSETLKPLRDAYKKSILDEFFNKSKTPGVKKSLLSFFENAEKKINIDLVVDALKDDRIFKNVNPNDIFMLLDEVQKQDRARLKEIAITLAGNTIKESELEKLYGEFNNVLFTIRGKADALEQAEWKKITSARSADQGTETDDLTQEEIQCLTEAVNLGKGITPSEMNLLLKGVKPGFDKYFPLSSLDVEIERYTSDNKVDPTIFLMKMLSLIENKKAILLSLEKIFDLDSSGENSFVLSELIRLCGKFLEKETPLEKALNCLMALNFKDITNTSINKSLFMVLDPVLKDLQGYASLDETMGLIKADKTSEYASKILNNEDWMIRLIDQWSADRATETNEKLDIFLPTVLNILSDPKSQKQEKLNTCKACLEYIALNTNDFSILNQHSGDISAILSKLIGIINKYDSKTKIEAVHPMLILANISNSTGFAANIKKTNPKTLFKISSDILKIDQPIINSFIFKTIFPAIIAGLASNKLKKRLLKKLRNYPAALNLDNTIQLITADKTGEYAAKILNDRKWMRGFKQEFGTADAVVKFLMAIGKDKNGGGAKIALDRIFSTNRLRNLFGTNYLKRLKNSMTLNKFEQIISNDKTGEYSFQLLQDKKLTTNIAPTAESFTRMLQSIITNLKNNPDAPALVKSMRYLMLNYPHLKFEAAKIDSTDQQQENVNFLAGKIKEKLSTGNRRDVYSFIEGVVFIQPKKLSTISGLYFVISNWKKATNLSSEEKEYLDRIDFYVQLATMPTTAKIRYNALLQVAEWETRYLSKEERKKAIKSFLEKINVFAGESKEDKSDTLVRILMENIAALKNHNARFTEDSENKYNALFKKDPNSSDSTVVRFLPKQQDPVETKEGATRFLPTSADGAKTPIVKTGKGEEFVKEERQQEEAGGPPGIVL
jgi:hypothetical protein